MRSRNLTLAAFAGGAAAFVAAIVLLAGGHVAPASAGETARLRTPARTAPGTTAARPRAPYAAPAPAVDDRTRGQARADAPAENAALERARDLFRRLEAAAGSRADLPGDLQRDLLAFLTAGEEDRAALFALAWDPAAPRMIVGRLKVFLMHVADAETRRVLLAAFDSFNPNAAALAEAAARAKDPDLFVASLRAAASPKERVEMMKRIPQGAMAEPHIAAWLLEAARDDADEGVRCIAYGELAVSGAGAAVPILAAAAGDPGRSLAERKSAAFALANHPDRPGVDDLLRLYADGPDEVRRNLLSAFATAPADRRVDDLLIEVLSSPDATPKTRRAAAVAIGTRLPLLPAAEARELGARTAEAVRSLTADDAVEVLTCLGGSVVKNDPLREALQDLHRTAPAGGAIQLAFVTVPALKFVAGL
jgi:hypothetical protein